MKFLLAAINAKYIHSNPGIYSLRTFAKSRMPEADIEIGEYTINHQMDHILQDIYRRKPDFIGFSCYIWNISHVLGLAEDLHAILPDTEIWLGGPEVSYDAEKILTQNPHIRGIMRGEGELIFSEVVKAYTEIGTESFPESSMEAIRGITWRGRDGEIRENGTQRLLSMDEIPFYYDEMDGFENRIVYYESSRGCPFSCSYCLSSIDKSVRFRSLELVKRELDFFLERQVPQVKFVDRTFNCKREHTLGIWRHILEHDNGITNFHFEVSADLFDEEELDLIRQMRPGLIQLEIGVQSTNPDTIREIRRKMDLEKLKAAVLQIHSFRNTHQHLDLIAGLPYEGLESFFHSFDDVYKMEPDQLQLGFLKVLKGSYMSEKVQDYDLKYRGTQPYEVLSTRWLSYADVIRLKAMEEMVEVYYNSGQFVHTMKLLEREFLSPSAMFCALAEYYDSQKLFGLSHNRLARYEILYEFLSALAKKRGFAERLPEYRDSLILDLYLRENAKSRPSFAYSQLPFKDLIRSFFQEEAKTMKWLPGYEEYDSRQISKMAHMEAMEDGTFLLFDYKNRDPLSYNARYIRLRFAKDKGWHRIFMADSYVAVDLETTGIGAKKEKIIEIGMVKVIEGVAADTFHTLINPHREIPERIVELTGIDDAMVKEAPGIEEVLPSVLAFCDGLPILGHQIIFDYGFLVQAAVNQGLKFEKSGIDTLKLCRKFMPAGEKKNLSSACAYFGIVPDTSHRALSDAMSAHRLYVELKKRFGNGNEKEFCDTLLQYKAKKERTATKRQKQHLQDLIKYHRINVTVAIDHMSGNEISRMIDRIIFTHGKIPEECGQERKKRN